MLPFSIGRQDCNKTAPDDGLPSSNLLTPVKLLKEQFSLSTDEAVALMGEI